MQECYIRISYENCLCMNSDVDSEKLKIIFTFYPEQIVFIQNKYEQVIGVISMGDFQSGLSSGSILINNNFKKIILHPGYMKEVRKFFEETEYQFIPILNADGKLIEYFKRKKALNLENYYDYRPELLIGKWVNTDNNHLAKLVQRKKYSKIKICIINSLSERIYDYFKHYRFFFESVEKVFWYDVGKVNKNELLIIDHARKMYLEINAIVYPLSALQIELEYNLLLQRCKENEARLYIVSCPNNHNISNVTQEERERICKNLSWTEYLENSEIYSDLLRQVLGMEDEERGRFIKSCLRLPSVVIKDQLCYQCEFSSEYVNVVGGNRVTVNTPRYVYNSVYMSGNSFVFGALVDDEHTISSLLQKKLGLIKNMKNYAVINEGIRGVPFFENLKRLNQDVFRKRDYVVLFIDLERFSENVGEQIASSIFKDIGIYHLEDVFNSLDRNKVKSYFIESPIHPNAFGYQLVADYLAKVFQEDYNDRWKTNIVFSDSPIAETQKKFSEEENGLKHYIEWLRTRGYDYGKNGSIVMNCNPLTYGHKYLIEYASKQVDHLYVFVVQEDKSVFSFKDRFKMVRACAKEYPNVIVVPSGRYIISSLTFAEYFTKQAADPSTVIDASRDVNIFGKYIAPSLNITVRYAGEEPIDYITAQYNQSMKRILPKYGIEFIEIPRYKDKSGLISATKVRKALQANNYDVVRGLVPETTYQILLEQHYLS